MVTKHIKKLQPSATLTLATKAKKLQAAGVSVVNLALGEPDFTTPDHIKRAAIRAIKAGFTHYTETAGTLELREAVSKKLSRENGISYIPEEIVIGVGSKQLLFHAFQALCERGDEVLVPVPTWSTYIEQIRLAGAIPVLVHLQPPFKLMARDLLEKVTSKTKVILLNTPSNPTGAIVDRGELKKIAKLAVKKKIFVVSDEIYEKILYESRHYSIASLGREIKKRTITIGGFSKAYAMTGWRIGYAVGPKEIIRAMISLQSQTTSSTSSISQKAAIEALTGPQKPTKEMVNEFKKRRDHLIKKFSEIKEISFTPPEGAFYLFVGIKKLLGKKLPTSEAWCIHLLEKEGVAVVPGEAFLYPGYFRLSFAASMTDISEATKRIKRYVEKYD